MPYLAKCRCEDVDVRHSIALGARVVNGHDQRGWDAVDHVAVVGLAKQRDGVVACQLDAPATAVELVGKGVTHRHGVDAAIPTARRRALEQHV